MDHRPLGRTGLSISAIAFGAGPVSGLMLGDASDQQAAVVARAIDRGINWFDTAPGYGQGRSEEALGRALEQLGVGERVHVATKVRLREEELDDIPGAVRRSVAESLRRLRRPWVTLLQLHNGVTARRGDEPTSITPADVLGPRGALAAFEEVRRAGLVRHLGLTGTGQPAALREVIHSGGFDTIQVPYHVLNPSAVRPMPPAFAETDYGAIVTDCVAQGMGVLAIRVFAAGALLDQPPSAHTLKTPFFPLALYERDRARAARLAQRLGPNHSLRELALRYVLGTPGVSAAILGLGTPEHVDEAVAAAAKGPLPADLRSALESAV